MGMSYLYCAVMLAVWLTLWLGVDRWWPGTLLGFGPRWMLLLPAGAVAIFASFWRRRALWIFAGTALVVLGPVMGFTVPRPNWGRRTGPTTRIVTCNVQGKGNLARLGGLCETIQPDVIALQEAPATASALFPESEGWHTKQHGELVVASRHPILHTETINSRRHPWRSLALQCDIEAPLGTMHVVCVHLMTPRSGLAAVMHSRLAGLDELGANTELRYNEAKLVSEWIRRISGPTIIAGDFNLLPESQIYREYFSNLRNTFSTSGWGWGATKFTKWHGVRIDHVLANEQFRSSSCYVAQDVGSDHRPVVAELRWNRPL